ncbi:MAG: rod shape-determining protein MreC [Acidobacteriota bacterium]
MEVLLHRYRHLTVLLVAIVAQLVLLAFQVRNNSDVRLIRVWAVEAVTPLARVLETGRSGASTFFNDYFVLLDVREQNKRLKTDLDTAQLENQYLRTELGTADRAQVLALFQKKTQNKTVPARTIMNSTASSSSVFVDVGSSQGVQKGMAVITPAGIVGKVTNVYPSASLVLLMTDPLFGAGVVSQNHRVQGTLKGQGNGRVMIDLIENEQTVDQGEWFYTSGNDLIFPKGLRVGQATVVRPGRVRKEVLVTPSGFENGVEEVLIVIEGVHSPIPDEPSSNQPITLQSAPPPETGGGVTASGVAVQTGPVATDADRLMDKLRAGKTPPKPAIPAAVGSTAVAPANPLARQP